MAGIGLSCYRNRIVGWRGSATPTLSRNRRVWRLNVKLFLLLTFVAIFVAADARQERVTISRGFFTGREYLDMTDTEKRAYATGAINGMLVAPFFGAPQDRVNWIKNCSARLSDEQTSAILTKYITEQAGQQDTSLNVLTFNAMRQACGK